MAKEAESPVAASLLTQTVEEVIRRSVGVLGVAAASSQAGTSL